MQKSKAAFLAKLGKPLIGKLSKVNAAGAGKVVAGRTKIAKALAKSGKKNPQMKKWVASQWVQEWIAGFTDTRSALAEEEEDPNQWSVSGGRTSG